MPNENVGLVDSDCLAGAPKENAGFDVGFSTGFSVLLPNENAGFSAGLSSDLVPKAGAPNEKAGFSACFPARFSLLDTGAPKENVGLSVVVPNGLSTGFSASFSAGFSSASTDIAGANENAGLLPNDPSPALVFKPNADFFGAGSSSSAPRLEAVDPAVDSLAFPKKSGTGPAFFSGSALLLGCAGGSAKNDDGVLSLEAPKKNSPAGGFDGVVVSGAPIRVSSEPPTGFSSAFFSGLGPDSVEFSMVKPLGKSTAGSLIFSSSSGAGMSSSSSSSAMRPEEACVRLRFAAPLRSTERCSAGSSSARTEKLSLRWVVSTGDSAALRFCGCSGTGLTGACARRSLRLLRVERRLGTSGTSGAGSSTSISCEPASIELRSLDRMPVPSTARERRIMLVRCAARK